MTIYGLISTYKCFQDPPAQRRIMSTAEADALSIRILVLAPPEPDDTFIRQVLNQTGQSYVLCPDVEQFAVELRTGAGTALLSEESLTPAVMERLIDLLGCQPPWSDFPLLLFFNSGGERIDTALRMLDMLAPLGNVTILERPVRGMTLVSTLRAALHARRRQYEVRDLLLQLEEAVRRRDVFLGELAHELRNPLGTIRTATHILEQSGMTEDQSAHQRTVIGRQTLNLARLIDDLLDASRVTSGKLRLRLETVDFSTVVEHAVRSLESTAQAEGIRVSFLDGTGRLPVQGDARRLEQIAANLLRNAISFTPAGGEIRVSLSRDDGAAVLRVADSGVGMDPAMVADVFNLMSPSHHGGDRPQGGLGIGLSLVRTLVEIHQGQITASSPGPGQGSEFVVRLPLAKGDAQPPTNGAGAATSASRRLLVVEDNPDGREALRTLLKLWGHQVEVASDGAEGVKKALAMRPEVALVDIGLPVLDGYEVARRVRSRLGQSVFLVALTGYGQPHDYHLAFEAGFDAHLVKPAEPDEIRRLIQRVPQSAT
jgi:signal transduction histidine kinase/ActR/RegA family two-component response regulator